MLAKALCLVVVKPDDRPVVVDEVAHIAVQDGAPISNDEGAAPHVVAVLGQVSVKLDDAVEPSEPRVGQIRPRVGTPQRGRCRPAQVAGDAI